MRGDVALQRLYIIDMYLLEMVTPEFIKPTKVVNPPPCGETLAVDGFPGISKVLNPEGGSRSTRGVVNPKGFCLCSRDLNRQVFLKYTTHK